MQRAQFAQTFANLAKLVAALWPPNWREVDGPTEDTLDTMLLDEGLCLAWVPPAAILRRLFTAETSQQRRRIIGSSWNQVVLAAKDELRQVPHRGCDITSRSRTKPLMRS